MAIKSAEEKCGYGTLLMNAMYASAATFAHCEKCANAMLFVRCMEKETTIVQTVGGEEISYQRPWLEIWYGKWDLEADDPYAWGGTAYQREGLPIFGDADFVSNESTAATSLHFILHLSTPSPKARDATV